MRRFATATATVFLLALIAAPVQPIQGATDADRPTQDERLEEIRQLKETLDDAREALAVLEESLRRAGAGKPGVTAEADVDQLRSDASELRSKILEGGDTLQTALVELINADPPIEGEPRTPAVEEALRVKAEEDVALAQEYIDRGGNYARAIQIYEDVLAYNPDNPEALAALERAQQMRYMDAERFARVVEGMTKAEVREALGPVNLRNTRAYQELGLEAWFYPKGADGRPAAVYFWERGGQWEVYRAVFDADELDR